MKSVLRTFVVSILLGLCTPAWADRIERVVDRAESLTAKGRFDEAIGTLHALAEANDGRVSYALAVAYLRRAIDGRAPTEIEPTAMQPAIDFSERAIGQGNPAGFNLLYQIFANGWGVPVDARRALGYLKSGSAAGDPGSRVNYAISLYEGNEIVDRDVDSACPLLKQLIEENELSVPVAHAWGWVHVRGQCGLPKNPAAGVEYLHVAAKGGVRAAERDYARALEAGWAGRDADPRAALRWYESAAKHGDGFSDWKLGLAHVEGRWRPKDSRKAVVHFQRSAQAGEARGMTSLAVMYATGDGVDRDFAKAMGLYEQAADAGDAHASRNLAVMYLKGEGVQSDPSRALTFYRRSVALGDNEDAALAAAIECALDPDTCGGE